nr:hypothetical protein [Tanacetum cinerariifolium]
MTYKVTRPGLLIPPRPILGVLQIGIKSQADDVLPPEEQLLPAAVSPTAESPVYITDSEPEMEPEEDDGDDENFEGDSIEYPTSRGDENADDDGDNLSEDDADDEDEEESLDSEEEEEEHLASTVPTPALHRFVPAFEDSDEIELFEEGETAATPPPFGYRVAARISVQPHILMSFCSESEVERLLAIPTPPLSLVSPKSYPLPPFLMPLPIFTPLPPPPIILPCTRASMALMRSATPSTFILAPRSRTPPIGTPLLLPIPLPTSSLPLPLLLQQIRPALTVADRRRADDRLIGRLRRERRYFHTLSTIYAQERDVSTLQRQHIDDEDRLTRHIQHEHTQRDKTAPKRARTTRANPDPTRTTTATVPMTQEAINNLISQRPRTVRPTRECTYKDYLNCGPLKVYGTEGVIGLTRWFERTESVSSISNCTAENQVKFASCTLIGSALTWWNTHMRAVSQEVAYAMPWKTLKQMMTAKIFPEESDEIERYVGGLPEMIQGNVMFYEPKSMQKAIEFAKDQMDQKLLGIADRQADNKRKFGNTLRNKQNQQPFRRNKNVARAYATGSEEKPYRGTKPLCPKCNFYHDGPCHPKCTNYKRTGYIARDCRSRAANNNNNNNNNNNQRATVAYQGVPTCFECGAQGHFKNNCPKLGNRNQGNRN